MKRIEINVQTGERKVVSLTAEEIADAVARTEAAARARAIRQLAQEKERKRLAALRALDDARLALAMGDATAPEEVKAYAEALNR